MSRWPCVAEVRREGYTPGVTDGRASSRPSLRVLVVEDSVDTAETMGELIRRWGHEVQLAHDGASALRAARAFRPQVILLDIGLPDIDGYAVADRLRGEDLGGDILVALTGYAEARDRARAKQAGFDRHITKPVAPDELLELLSTASGSSASGAA
jgi:CheY-like chemotaxis protein